MIYAKYRVIFKMISHVKIFITVLLEKIHEFLYNTINIE